MSNQLKQSHIVEQVENSYHPDKCQANQNNSQQYISYNSQEKSWYYYNPQIAPAWQKTSETFVNKIVIESLEERKCGYNNSDINGVVGLLKKKFSRDDWNLLEKEEIPLKNGILNANTKELRHHSPQHYLTWHLNYDYDPTATCEPIKNWLNETMGEITELVNLILCFLKCLILCQTQYQKYLEISGPGGTGKSTFLKLITLLIGESNTFSTSLTRLNNRFETYHLMNKRLTIVPDAEASYSGNIETLKTLTGEDLISSEIKFGGRVAFVYKGLVIVAGNTSMSHADSAINRRRIFLPFERIISQDKRRDLIPEFIPYLSGFLNLILEMDDAEVEKYMRHSDQLESLKKIQQQKILSNHPLGFWFDESVEFVPNKQTFVGKGDPEQANEKLYPNYLKFCKDTKAKPISLRIFSADILDLCRQLKLEVSKKKDWQSGVYLTNLALKNYCQPAQPLEALKEIKQAQQEEPFDEQKTA